MTSAGSDTTRVPKVLGSDVELGNFIDGLDSPSGSGPMASRLLLRQIPGIPANQSNGTQDWGRRFLPGSGGCVYVDLDHLELCTPETLSAFDYVTYSRAMLRIARDAVQQVNAQLPRGHRVHAFANCGDGHGNSYGAHLSVLLSRAAWDAIVRRKPHYLACLAAFQASSIIFTGAGKVGGENDRPWTDFQISQRADFIETFLGEQTTYRRPLVNSRDEPLCGPASSSSAPGHDASGLARLHCICFDATLCQTATLLRAGTMQVILSMLEAGEAPAHLALDDPLDALQAWSRDPSLEARARLVSGELVTALELQTRFLEQARTCAQTMGFDAVVPRSQEILALWDNTLARLRERDWDTLARRLDWVLKRRILERAITSRPSLSWSSPELRHLDQLYASIDETEGLFWACEQAGLVDVIAGDAEVRRAIEEPPEDTRAWTRAHLLRRAGTERVEEIDWDRIGIRLDIPGRPRWWSDRTTVGLRLPYGATSRDHHELFAPGRALPDIVAALETYPQAAAPLPVKYTAF